MTHKNEHKLRMKMSILKTKISTPYMGVYEFLHGKQNASQRQRIRNVWNLRIVDETIISNFSKLEKKLGKSKA